MSRIRLYQRAWFKRLSLVVAGAIVVIAFGGWLARDWLKNEALAVVRNKLAQSGIHVEWESAGYYPQRGLVLENVTCYRDASASNKLLVCGNIGIDLGWSQLLRDRSLNGWKAKITISEAPVVAFDNESPVLTVSETSLDAIVTAKDFEIARLEGLVNGLQLMIDGRVLFPTGSAPNGGTTKSETESNDAAKLDVDLSPLKAVGTWAAFSSEGRAPELNLSITYEPKNANNAFTAEGSLEGKNFTWRTMDVDETDIEFSYGIQGDKLALSKLNLVYEGNRIEGRQISYSLGDQRLSIGTLSSNADLLSLARSISPDAMANVSPVRLPHPPIVTVSGSIPVGYPQASDLQFAIGGENELTIVAPDSPPLSLAGLSGKIALKDKQLSTGGLTAGVLGAGISYSGRANVFDKDAPLLDGEVSITGLSTSRLLTHLNNESDFAGKVNATFKGTAGQTFESIDGSGSVRLKSEKFDADVPYRLRRGLLESDAATFRPKDGGTATFAGKVDLNQRPFIATGRTRIDEVPLAAIFRLAGSERSMEGKLAASYDGVLSSDTSKLTGEGSVSITDGHLYHVPVLGALEALIDGVVPNFTREKNENLSGNFTAKKGSVETNNLSVVSDATRIDLAGSFNLPERTTEFTATANLNGIAGLSTLLVSKLLEIRGTGALTEPRLTMKNVPLEIASGAVKTAAGAGKATVDIVGKVGQSGTDVVTDSVGRVGDGVKKIGEDLNKLNPLSIKRKSKSP